VVRIAQHDIAVGQLHDFEHRKRIRLFVHGFSEELLR
jgi:hypothetical protein